MNLPERDLTYLDLPEMVRLIFYPRKHQGTVRETEDTYSISFTVDEDIKIIGRFYKAEDNKNAPTILFFHGNGEIVTDYDFIGPTYQQMRINFL